MAQFKKISFVVTEAFLAELKERRFFTKLEKTDQNWLREGAKIRLNAPVWVEPYSAIRTGSSFFNIGAFSYSRSNLPHRCKVGRYCVIAPNVSVMGVNHPIERVSMCGIDYSTRAHFKAAREDFGRGPALVKRGPAFGFKPPVIEHDVWIGDGALIAQDVRIGTGSIVAARSIVTKDVPPYSIVAGAPAVVKRRRFDETLTQKLLDLAWWQYKFVDFDGMSTTDPANFVSQLEDSLSQKRLEPWVPQKTAIHEVALEYADVLALT